MIDGLRLGMRQSNKEFRIIMPGRLHALRADRHGQWAMDLEHPKRLILEPLGDPVPYDEDGHLDLIKVTAIQILGMEDYHGK